MAVSPSAAGSSFFSSVSSCFSLAASWPLSASASSVGFTSPPSSGLVLVSLPSRDSSGFGSSPDAGSPLSAGFSDTVSSAGLSVGSSGLTSPSSGFSAVSCGSVSFGDSSVVSPSPSLLFSWAGVSCSARVASPLTCWSSATASALSDSDVSVLDSCSVKKIDQKG